MSKKPLKEGDDVIFLCRRFLKKKNVSIKYNKKNFKKKKEAPN